MPTPSETHNRLAEEFVQMAGRSTHSATELMVVTETTMLASLRLLVMLYNVQPSNASALMEVALQRATDRFAGTEQ